MNVLIPMAGEGSRFQKEGWTIPKPLIPITDRRGGEDLPMVVAATLDIPFTQEEGTQTLYVDRVHHKKLGIQDAIKEYVPSAEFTSLDYLTEGQACTCLAIKEKINNHQELFIGACDCGMTMDLDLFYHRAKTADAMIFTHTNDLNIQQNPSAHSWAEICDDGYTIRRVSIKKPVSDQPLKDHATTGMFWFKRGSEFVRTAEMLIDRNDKFGSEYYVDQVMQVAIDEGLAVMIMDVHYICWGTPSDLKIYEETLAYWKQYIESEPLLPK